MKCVQHRTVALADGVELAAWRAGDPDAEQRSPGGDLHPAMIALGALVHGDDPAYPEFDCGRIGDLPNGAEAS